MWNLQLLGTDVYHLIAAFCVYSVIGWFVESVYMSLCNRKLTNRGFAKGPYCPIYGVGALSCYFLFRPFASNYVQLYLIGAISATLFEFIVGKLMIRLFGEAWWDYHEKPCNYQGLICLESTVAWGFYAIFIIAFLHRAVLGLIDRYRTPAAFYALRLLLLVFAVDFFLQFLRALHIDIEEKRDRLYRKYLSFKARWY